MTLEQDIYFTAEIRTTKKGVSCLRFRANVYGQEVSRHLLFPIHYSSHLQGLHDLLEEEEGEAKQIPYELYVEGTRNVNAVCVYEDSLMILETLVATHRIAQLRTRGEVVGRLHTYSERSNSQLRVEESHTDGA